MIVPPFRTALQKFDPPVTTNGQDLKMGRLEEDIPCWNPSFFSFNASFRGSTCPLGVLTSLKPFNFLGDSPALSPATVAGLQATKSALLSIRNVAPSARDLG